MLPLKLRCYFDNNGIALTRDGQFNHYSQFHLNNQSMLCSDNWQVL
uniref:Uncharacterized protein n=1 Tax=Yersinia pseudotuberculosis serotype O:3 (strain YPIII) TaxID=502800 RepID=A0A0H3B2D4_YERPY